MVYINKYVEQKGSLVSLEENETEDKILNLRIFRAFYPIPLR